jgi:hypothetical protein
MPFLLCPDAWCLCAWLMHLGLEFRNRAFTFPGRLSPPAAFPSDFVMPWSMVLSQLVLDAKFANATTRRRFGRLPGLSQILVLSELPIEMGLRHFMDALVSTQDLNVTGGCALSGLTPMLLTAFMLT